MGKSRWVWVAVCALAAASSPAAAQTASNGLLGDAGGVRTALGKYGVTLNVTDSENLLGNLSGGVKTTFVMEVDTGKAFGLAGGTLHISALDLHGRPISGPYLDDLQAANGNEGEDGARLWELWYDQSSAGGKVDFKIGQQSIDNEFMVSQYSGLFVNTMAGWPLIPSADLYGGGPAYPLASPGARIQVKPAGNATILAGVFDDNPGGGGFADDAQALDRDGGRFNLNTGALFISELQVTGNAPAMFQHGPALPGTYKIGFWVDTGSFPDQRFDTDGVALADPDSNGIPAQRHGNDSVYGVVDQTIWQSAADTSRNVNIFGRIMGAPSDRNLVDFSFNGGMTLAAPLPGRDNDNTGIDFGVGHVGSRAGAHGTETLIELTYQAQVTPWLTLQPDLQYVANPGAGVADPDAPVRNLRNEVVAGVRVVGTF
jgi:porin